MSEPTSTLARPPASPAASPPRPSRTWDWNEQQAEAIGSTVRWGRARGGPQVRRIFGWAGTGKTSLAEEVATQVADGDKDARVLYAAFTGKAALVLRGKGCRGASTIHSLIYKADKDAPPGQPAFKLNRDSDVRGAKLVVIDEVSMVDHDLGEDLLSFGTKVLVLGDPFQLPPVKGSGYFTNARPDVMLTDVRRQAEGNPIVRLATDVREGRPLLPGSYGETRVIYRSEVVRRDVLAADAVIVGMNRTRHRMNRDIRGLRGFTAATPVIGDRLVCLRNNRERGLLNGSLWDVAEVKGGGDGTVQLSVRSVDDPAMDKPVDVEVPVEFFRGDDAAVKRLDPLFRRKFDEFDFGAALTCHKTQGSQYSAVTVFDEGDVFREDAARWKYTALTRAAERLTWVLPDPQRSRR